jgi:hypothetical protein
LLEVIFAPAEIVSIRQGRKTGHLIPRGEQCRVGRIRRLRRRTDDGGWEVVLGIVDPLSGEQRPMVVTIESAEVVRLSDLGLSQAKACGHRTTSDLRAEFRGRHPRAGEAQLVRFTLGDSRDMPQYLTWTRMMIPGRIGDYTLSPTLGMEEAAPAGRAILSRQEQMRREFDRSPAGSLAGRAARLRIAHSTGIANLHTELRVIDQRRGRALRRIEG